MLFNSIAFAVFLPIVFFGYWITPAKYRWIIMLISSYYFYMSWNPKYVILILLTTIVSYSTALVIGGTDKKFIRKLSILIALLVCIGILFIFKYFNFFSEFLYEIFSKYSIPATPITLKLMLPVGISFYSFQTLSYVIDVYRGDVKAEKHLGYYMTFISFFPQLVAGPIERTANLLPQIKKEHKFNYEQAILGTKYMLIGFFKKLVIADIVSEHVDRVYADVHLHSGFALLLAVLFFTMQIYCDFSGYSDIALGTAKLFGIELMINFKSPYFSSSLKEFWSRWHISLSTWFRDYIYIPRGGNRGSALKRYSNLLFTFTVSGLWHGASWMFLIWGFIHGVAQIIEKIFDKYLMKIKSTGFGRIISVCAVFIFCNISWIFFRAGTVEEGRYILSNMFCGILSPSEYFQNSLEIGRAEMVLIFLPIFCLAIYDYYNIEGTALVKIEKWNKFLQWMFYIVIGLMIVFLSQKGVAAEFVYFQF